MNKYLSWVEIKKDALAHNIKEFKRITSRAKGADGSASTKVASCVRVAPCVKSNAYGHGLIGTSRVFVEELEQIGSL